MEKDGGKDTDHETGNWVGVIAEKLSSCTPSHNLGSRSEKFKTEQKEVKEEDNETESKKDVPPFLTGVNAAGAANFFPRGVGDFFFIFSGKVNISHVHGSGRTFLSRPGACRVHDGFLLNFRLSSNKTNVM